MTIQLAGFVSEALKPKNRARGGQSKFAVALFGGGDERGGITFTFTTLLQIDSASAATTEIIAALCHSHPQGRRNAGGTPSLIHHNKSIARGQKMNVSMEGAA